MPPVAFDRSLRIPLGYLLDRQLRAGTMEVQLIARRLRDLLGLPRLRARKTPLARPTRFTDWESA